MSLFKPATNDQAYLKMGVMGFTGSGKTYTASLIARGLHKILRERKVPGGDSPVFFADTETGSDWVRDDFAKDGIPLEVSKTRAQKDLVPMIREVEKCKGIVIIDSITHFWQELCDSYAKKKNRTKLEFQDWAYLKQKWREFTDEFVNSETHIIMCGRAGYEYDFFVNEAGKKELEKTGVKMKAEGETGYEPSILVRMDRRQEMNPDKTMTVWRTAEILKDRSRELDGKVISNPTFKDFLPHINHLNLGGVHVGIDTSRSTEDQIKPDGASDWQREKRQKDIILDEIKEVITKHFPGQSTAEKKDKADLLEKYCGSRSWARVETFDLRTLESSRNELWKALEGQPYNMGSELKKEAEGFFGVGDDNGPPADVPLETGVEG